MHFMLVSVRAPFTDSIQSHVLTNLHCVLVMFHSDFKVLLITFKALNGLVLNYIKDLLTPNVLVSLDLLIPRSRLVSKGDPASADSDQKGTIISVFYIHS